MIVSNHESSDEKRIDSKNARLDPISKCAALHYFDNVDNQHVPRISPLPVAVT